MKNKNLLNSLESSKKNGEKLFAILVDPDKTNGRNIAMEKGLLDDNQIDLFLVGGSLVKKQDTSRLIKQLQHNSERPVYLFPGSPVQYCEDADGLLFLSLISGRNADLLIGRHVEVAPTLVASAQEVIPTGYMLVNDGMPTSASYMSNTMPIPSQKADIALATAQAGQLLGLRCIYMDAGSGAEKHIPLKTIETVAHGIDIPLIVGGGIRNEKQKEAVHQAGAQMVVMGTAFENH